MPEIRDSPILPTEPNARVRALEKQKLKHEEEVELFLRRKAAESKEKKRKEKMTSSNPNEPHRITGLFSKYGSYPIESATPRICQL